MQQGSNSRRGRTRADTPKTIDLAPDEVKEKPSPVKAGEEKTSGEKQDKPAAKAETPAAEPVAVEETADKPTGKPIGEPRPTSAGHSGFGPTAASGATSEAASEAGARTGKTSPSRAAGSWGRESAGKAGAADKPASAAKSSGGGTSGLATILASGLVGALVALLLLGGLNTIGALKYVPVIGSLATSKVDAPAVPDLSADVAALDKRIAALEEAAQTPAPESSALSATLDKLSSRLSQTESALQDLTARTADTGTLDRLKARIDELAGQVEAAAAQNAATGSATGAAIDNAALAKLRDEVSAVSGTTGSLKQQVDSLSGRINAVEASVEALKGGLASADAARGELASKQQAARAVAADALRAAYRRGEPFTDLIDSLEALTGPSDAIDALKPYAATGLATDAGITNGFNDAASRILAASAPKGGGVVSRLLSNARALVSVRPEGPVEGNTPQAIVSRIAADLANAEFDKALAEWRTLPDEAKAASRQWGQKLQRRVDADRLLGQIVAGLGSNAAAN